MKTKNTLFTLALFFCFQFQIDTLTAQLVITPQIMQRAEYRHGFGALLDSGKYFSSFMGQRTRLEGKYEGNNMLFFCSFQDIRIWGTTPLVKISDGLTSLHEGYVIWRVDSNFSLKIGRQEMSYDNLRFLGNVDWLLQARSHDLALAKYESGRWKIHGAMAWSQTAESLNGNFYMNNTAGYKTAQMLWANYKTSKLELGFITWNNGVQAVRYDTAGKRVMLNSIRFTQTIGIPALRYSFGKLTLNGFLYMQVGKDSLNNNVNAFDASLYVSYSDKIKKGSVTLTGGGEILSGTSNNAPVTERKSYNPLFGNNHAHNGVMDYFYVLGRYEKNAGLQDFYIRMKYESEKKNFISLNIHYFLTQANLYKGNTLLDKTLGQELDLTYGYIINKAFSVQAGYSQFFGTSSMEFIHKTINAQKTNNWAYLMLLYRPGVNAKKFSGVIF